MRTLFAVDFLQAPLISFRTFSIAAKLSAKRRCMPTFITFLKKRFSAEGKNPPYPISKKARAVLESVQKQNSISSLDEVGSVLTRQLVMTIRRVNELTKNGPKPEALVKPTPLEVLERVLKYGDDMRFLSGQLLS